jgi:dUTP pyrophosphatase
MEKVNKGFGDMDQMMEWLDDAPETVWEIMLPQIKEELDKSVANGEMLEEMRKSIIEGNKTEQNLLDELATIKSAMDLFNAGKPSYKKKFLEYLYEAMESCYKQILEEGFAPRIQVPIEISVDGTMPTYANKGDAGADVFIQEDINIIGGSTIVISTGLKVALPDGWELQVRPRSGLSLKSPLRIANSPGTIDSGYRDEIGIIVTNTSDGNYKLQKGDRIAQLVLAPIYKAKFVKVDNVAEIGANRGGGFGSTGL